MVLAQSYHTKSSGGLFFKSDVPVSYSRIEPNFDMGRFFYE